MESRKMTNVRLATDEAALSLDENVRVKPITGIFGAAIVGIDLSQPLGPDALTTILKALNRYRVLVFRDQNGVQPRQLLDFATCFGAPEVVEHPSHRDVDGVVGVKVLHSDAIEMAGRVTDSWHTDGATREQPRYISVLQAIDVPDFGRDTMFADMVAAFERLSEPMKAFLEGLEAEHNWGMQKPGSPSVYHPLIATDVNTGAKALYVNRTYTKSIVGLRKDESDHLLEFLVSQARQPELQIRVAWEPGTIVVWNNQLTQHYLVFDRAYPRVMHRVMVS